MREEAVRPSRILYVISALIFVAGITLFVHFLISGISASMDAISTQVVVPGESTVKLDEAGTYTIYFEKRSVLNGKVYEVNSIDGLNCSVKNAETGEDILLLTSVASSNYSVSGREGKSLFEFFIDKPGNYVIAGNYESGTGEEAVLAIGKGFFGVLFRSIILSIVTLLGTFGLSIGLFLFTLVKRQKNKQAAFYGAH